MLRHGMLHRLHSKLQVEEDQQIMLLGEVNISLDYTIIGPRAAIAREGAAWLNNVDDEIDAQLDRMDRVQLRVLLAETLELRKIAIEHVQRGRWAVGVNAADDAVGRDDAVVGEWRPHARIELRCDDGGRRAKPGRQSRW